MTCTPREQQLRNCSGKGTPAKNFLNGHLYTRCPKAIFLENPAYKHIVNTYFECRAQNRYPADGSYGEQAAYCIEVFEFLDQLRYETDKRRLKEAQKASEPKKR